MARGKKASGKHYVSKGERPNQSAWIRKQSRREYKGSLDQAINQLTAASKGKRAVMTLPNANAENKKHSMVRVKLGYDSVNKHVLIQY